MKVRGPPLIKASYDELVSFVRHYQYHGTPIIIGGWAVWFYNPYFGSIDVDVVGPSYQGEFYRIIEEYEHTHGYQVISTGLSGVEVVASKPIFSGGRRWERWKLMPVVTSRLERVGSTRISPSRSPIRCATILATSER